MAKQNDPSQKQPENQFVAGKLADVADLLAKQGAIPFRVRAYQSAADYVAALPQPIRDVYRETGRRGLEDLPTIGDSIAAAIAELLDTGRLGILDRLRGSSEPEKLFQTVPMIGPHLAKTIHDTLHIDTLEALEAAAADGRLANVKGIGRRRVDAIRNSLNNMLARRRPSPRQSGNMLPTVSDILAVDQSYRESADTLPTIQPRRFNESGDLRIPILHTERGAWEFTALYSNSSAAHQYGKTRDWVVIYYERDNHPEGQSTVVTQRGGVLEGKRVIRGREEECEDFYRS